MGSTRSPLAATAGDRHGGPEGRPRQILVQPAADPRQHARAYCLQRSPGRQQEGNDCQKCDECLRAAARQNAVVDLEHEQRAGEGQDVDGAGKEADAGECGARAGERDGKGIVPRN